MTTGQRYLYEKAEELARDWADEIQRNRVQETGSIGGLIAYSGNRAALIMEVLKDIFYLERL